MTEKELRKLNRYQLLELLVMQSTQVQDLQKQLEEARRELDSRDIQMTVVGSIAEASVQVGGLLEAAQKTADVYLDAVKERIEIMETEATRRAEQIMEEARQKAQRIIEDANMAIQQ